MRPDLFLQYFDRISDAPDAIPRLRRFILDLAVRGKLVEQDPRDEPASELLNRIQAEKARLVREGEIRNELPLPPIEVQDLPVESPGNWKWARLGDTSMLITKGSTPTSYGHAFVPTGINFIKVESIKNGRLVPGNVTSFISEETNNFLARSRLVVGDILFSIAGSIGTCARVAENILPANTNQALAIIRGTDLVFDAEFILICIKSSIAHLVLAKARGGAMNNVSLEDIRNFVIPVPPLHEQHRIVAKVDELMALCDRLEATQAERESRRDRLAASSLNRLNNGEDPDAFQDHARFYFNHLPRLTTRTEHIQQLRQTILNLAIRGKLVPQDPNDEPAEKLSVRPEQKGGKWVGPIEEQEVPFQLPPSWIWFRLGDISSLKHGYAFSSEFFTSEPAPFVLTTPGNFYEKGGFRDRESKRKYYSGPVDPEFIFKPGDLIIPMTEQAAGLLGSPAFIPDDGRGYVHNQRLGKLGFSESIAPEFAFWFFNSEFFRGELARTCTGMKVRHTSPDRVLKVPFPLPPLAEQHRIVTKVDELMALCDRLEAQLTTTQTESRRLLEAVLHEALTETNRQELADMSCR